MIHCLPTFLKTKQKIYSANLQLVKNCWDIVLKQGNFGEQNIP